MDKYIGTVFRYGLQSIGHTEIPFRSACGYMLYLGKVIFIDYFFPTVFLFPFSVTRMISSTKLS